MKYFARYSGLMILIMVLVIGCGPSEKEKQQREQARQDSLEQAREDSLQRIRQQRQDSLDKVRADSLVNTRSNKNQQNVNISLGDNGAFSLQVESWRSKVKAQKRADMWKERGFNNAFVVQYGTEDTGNVWYRVRLGQTDSRQKAKEIQQQLKDEYQAQAWIGSAD